MAPYPTFRRQYGVISDISTPVWRHIRHFDASMVPYPTFRRQYGVISNISTPVWRHIPHFDASMASYPTFRRQYGAIYHISTKPRKITKSMYVNGHEIAQRSFFGPSGGKSDTARSFLMVPRPTFDIPWPPSVGFCSHFDSVPRIKKCELSTD